MGTHSVTVRRVVRSAMIGSRILNQQAVPAAREVLACCVIRNGKPKRTQTGQTTALNSSDPDPRMRASRSVVAVLDGVVRALGKGGIAIGDGHGRLCLTIDQLGIAQANAATRQGKTFTDRLNHVQGHLKRAGPVTRTGNDHRVVAWARYGVNRGACGPRVPIERSRVFRLKSHEGERRCECIPAVVQRSHITRANPIANRIIKTGNTHVAERGTQGKDFAEIKRVHQVDGQRVAATHQTAVVSDRRHGHRVVVIRKRGRHGEALPLLEQKVLSVHLQVDSRRLSALHEVLVRPVDSSCPCVLQQQVNHVARHGRSSRALNHRCVKAARSIGVGADARHLHGYLVTNACRGYQVALLVIYAIDHVIDALGQPRNGDLGSLDSTSRINIDDRIPSVRIETIDGASYHSSIVQRVLCRLIKVHSGTYGARVAANAAENDIDHVANRIRDVLNNIVKVLDQLSAVTPNAPGKIGNGGAKVIDSEAGIVRPALAVGPVVVQTRVKAVIQVHCLYQREGNPHRAGKLAAFHAGDDECVCPDFTCSIDDIAACVFVRAGVVNVRLEADEGVGPVVVEGHLHSWLNRLARSQILNVGVVTINVVSLAVPRNTAMASIDDTLDVQSVDNLILSSGTARVRFNARNRYSRILARLVNMVVVLIRHGIG